MKKLALAAVLALSLVGCATFQKVENAVGVIAQTKINSKSAYVASNVFNAAERSATAYLKVPPCDGVLKVWLAAGAAEAIDQPFRRGIQGRNALRAYMRANKGACAAACPT